MKKQLCCMAVACALALLLVAVDLLRPSPAVAIARGPTIGMLQITATVTSGITATVPVSTTPSVTLSVTSTTSSPISTTTMAERLDEEYAEANNTMKDDTLGFDGAIVELSEARVNGWNVFQDRMVFELRLNNPQSASGDAIAAIDVIIINTNDEGDNNAVYHRRSTLAPYCAFGKDTADPTDCAIWAFAATNGFWPKSDSQQLEQGDIPIDPNVCYKANMIMTTKKDHITEWELPFSLQIQGQGIDPTICKQRQEEEEEEEEEEGEEAPADLPITGANLLVNNTPSTEANLLNSGPLRTNTLPALPMQSPLRYLGAWHSLFPAWQPQRLTLPAIGVDTPVVPLGWHTTTNTAEQRISEWDVVDYAAGWHINSALPGQIGNVVLSGHNNVGGAVFQDLYKLKLGDEVIVWMDQGKSYTYIVDQVIIRPYTQASAAIQAANLQMIGQFADKRITLVSCWPATRNSHRVFVVAHLR